ncbi:SDR family NAD(P)-dependent oxidoreductase [Tateyamaria sp.]|uniref:SDR family NAD(P)-dependent oxidoreductase n=1 Tax=Tateyamaria sp. TaxID=1929288 RepID=UPI00326E9DB5
MQIDFSGKFFAVTGTSGIGLEAALYLARSGARVFLAGIDSARNAEASAMAKAESLSVTVSKVDVSNTSSVTAWAEEIAGQTDSLHGLVNAAAIQTYGTVATTTPVEWDHTIAVNLRSCYLTSHLLYQLLRAANGAAIVHVSSVQGHANQNAVLAYATTKGAIHALTRAMAVDCAADKIRVNSVSPGSVRTPLLEFSARELAKDGKSMEDMIVEFGKSNPLGRVGTTDETSAMIAYLCSAAAGFVTGADMKIDGGLTAQLGV